MRGTRWRWRRCGALALCLLAAAGLAGCWSSVRIEELAYVAAMGVDAGGRPGEVRVTLAIIRPPLAVPPSGAGGGGGRTTPFYIVSGEGATLSAALDRVRNQTSRRVFLGELQAVVFGRRLAERGVEPYLGFLLRDPELRPSLFVYTATGSARTVVATASALERLPHRVFFGFEQHGPRPAVTAIQIKDFEDYLAEPGIDPVTPLVGVDCTHARSAGISDLLGCPGGGTPEVREEGTAVYRGDRLATTIRGQAALPLRWLLDRRVESDLSVRLPDGRLATVRVRSVARRLRVVSTPEGFSLHLRLDVQAGLSDMPGDRSGMTEPSLRRLDAGLDETLRNLVQAAVSRCSLAGTDPTGAGWWLARHRPAVWSAVHADWRSLLPRMPADVRVRVHIRATGLTR